MFTKYNNYNYFQLLSNTNKMKSEIENQILKVKNIKLTDNDTSNCSNLKNDTRQEMITKCIEKSKVTSEGKKNLSISDYCGLISKEGHLKVRSKHNLKKQSYMHSFIIKREKRRRKFQRLQKQLRLEKLARRKEGKTKQIRKKRDLEEIKLNKMIVESNCRGTVIHSRKKWYDDK